MGRDFLFDVTPDFPLRGSTYANPYWDAVSDLVTVERYHPWEQPSRQIGGDVSYSRLRGRYGHTDRYAWTITAPDTVAFVAEHLGPRAIDPLAGTGYWAYLLGQLGIDVAASDIAPPSTVKNGYHKLGVTHAPVAQADAVDAVTVFGEDRTLLLSWPPYDEPIGARILDAYQGPRFVFIGEGEGGCCGGDDMWSAINTGWHEIADHRPVQWYGLHDWVTVYERGTEA